MDRLSLIATAFFLAAVLPVGAQSTSREQPPQVVGNGVVDVVVAPKRALLLLGLTGEGSDGQGAIARLQELEDSVARALDGLVSRIIPWGIGFGENQQVRRMMMPAEPGLTTSRDYLARAGLAVHIDQMDQLMPVITRLAMAGVKAIMGVQFLLEEADPAVIEATSQATRLARAQAETIASAAGGRLGRVIRLSPAPMYPQPLLQRFSWSDQTGVPLTPSEVMIRVTVQGVWEFVSTDR